MFFLNDAVFCVFLSALTAGFVWAIWHLDRLQLTYWRKKKSQL